ncbi:MAG: hypothetical protein J7L58_00310 [Thermoplasmata archaeon]|nr:hypothetical protein [Thermoplasmata archaeon]
MPGDEEGVNWQQLIATSLLSIVTSVVSAVIIHEFVLKKKEEKKRPAERAVQEEAKAVEPVLREEDDYWVIEHHLEAQSWGTAPAVGGIMELGIKDNRVWMRRLWLPKAKYSREFAEKILAGVSRCAWCRTGLPLGEFSGKPAGINLISVPRQRIMRGEMATTRTVGSLVAGGFVGKGIDYLLDRTLSTKLGTLELNAVKTFAGLAAVLLPFGIRMGDIAENILVGAGVYLVPKVVEVIEELVAAAPAGRVELIPVSGTPAAPQSKIVYTETGPVDIEIG